MKPSHFPTQPKSQLERFDILDALRAVLAFWVAIGHLGVFPLMGVHPAPGAFRLIERFLNSTVWGMPAVMAFFVISGFCIHYPLHNGRDFNPLQFYLRRYTRILIPAAVIITVLAMRGHIAWSGRDSVFFSGTLWSLLCEEIYYALYPGLRALRQRIGWTPILATTAVISITLATLATPARDWFSIGALRTAAVLYPVWILGCIMAEQATTTRRTVTTPRIWTWRAGIWLAMWVTEAMDFHTPISRVHTMLFMGALSYLWIRTEIDYGRTHATTPWLMKAGAWSYSLYLVHPLVFDALVTTHTLARNSTTRTEWVFKLCVGLVLSYLFFLLVERPSHLLARRIGAKSQAPERALMTRSRSNM
ncbi:MAG: acyltransferase family protein [Janthinobacterium lividum]